MLRNEVRLQRHWIVLALGVTAVALVSISLATQLALRTSDSPIVAPLALLMNVDGERTVPAAYSSLLLLLAALALLVITVLKRNQREPFVAHWAVLTAGFVCMAADEAMSYHEKLILPMRRVLGNEDLGIFYFAWVLPGLVLVAILSLFFIRFLWRLPRRTAALFMLAAALYLGGALGVELLGGNYAEANGQESLTYTLIVTFEESLEMAGAIVYINALLVYLCENYGVVTVRIESHQAMAAAPHPGMPGVVTHAGDGGHGGSGAHGPTAAL